MRCSAATSTIPPRAGWTASPGSTAARAVPADEARFAPLMQGAAQRFPFLADAGVVKLVCHPDAMTPDGNPLVGELPGVPGFFVAAGLSLNGFGGAGGIGKAVAELVTARRERARSAVATAPGASAPSTAIPLYAAENAREAYRYYYRLRYPLDSDVLGRPAAHERAARAHAGRGCGVRDQERLGARRLLRARAALAESGEEQRGFGWAEPPYAAVLAEESAALRERVGLIDMTSFGKIAVEGPGPPRCSSACATRTSTASPGSVVYTQFLNDARRHRGRRDRHAPRRAALPRRHGRRGDRLRPRLAAPAHRARATSAVELRDETDALCVIGMWGPHARDVLQAVTRGRRRRQPRSRSAAGGRSSVGGARGLGAAHHLRRRARI